MACAQGVCTCAVVMHYLASVAVLLDALVQYCTMCSRYKWNACHGHADSPWTLLSNNKSQVHNCMNLSCPPAKLSMTPRACVLIVTLSRACEAYDV